MKEFELTLIFTLFIFHLSAGVQLNCYPCQCEADKKLKTINLLCDNTKTFAKISNVHFNNVTLVKNAMINEKTENVTCDVLHMKSVYLVDEINMVNIANLNYTLLKMDDADMDLLGGLVKVYQPSLKTIDVNVQVDDDDCGDIEDLSELVNLETLRINNQDQAFWMRCLKLNKFSLARNQKLKSIKMSAIIRYFDDNSLVLNSKNDIDLDISLNEMDIWTLMASNLSNHPGKISKLDLSYNKIDELDEKWFSHLIEDNPGIEIDLTGNPVMCYCNTTSWIYDGAFKDNLLNITCINMNKSMLFSMSRDHLCEPQQSDRGKNVKTKVQLWPIIAASFCLGITIIIILAIYIRRRRRLPPDKKTVEIQVGNNGNDTFIQENIPGFSIESQLESNEGSRSEQENSQSTSFTYVAPINEQKDSSSETYLNFIDAMPIERSRLKFEKHIGKGEFGYVDLAKFFIDNKQAILVAIKSQNHGKSKQISFIITLLKA